MKQNLLHSQIMKTMSLSRITILFSGVLVGFITWTGCLGSVTCDAADGSVEDAVMVECDLPRLNAMANDQLNGNPG
jgi:hypothetical protein